MKNKIRLRFQALIMFGCLLFISGLSDLKVSAITTNNTGWFFTAGSWENPSATYPNGTNSWRTVDGSDYHYGSDYYAQDWNWGGGDADSGKQVRSPIGGKVLWAGFVNNGYGNSVIIQWDTDSNYAWRAAHLSNINKSILDRFTKGEAVYVLTGDIIGKVGNTGSNDYHLHSSFYKNITQFDGDTKAIAKLKKGGALGSTTTGGADKFAYSQCERFSNTNVVLFNFTQCLGDKMKLSPGFYNLSERGYDDKTKSIYIPSGWSAKIYRDSNRGGSNRCLTGSMWNLQRDSYTDGTLIALKDTTNGVGTISSIEIFKSNNCTAPLVDGMTFDGHASHPDGTSLQVNTPFVKKWRLKNTGTTTWNVGYKVHYVSGNQMNGPAFVYLPQSVAPNTTVEVAVNLKTPPNTGTKTGIWELRNSNNAKIGNSFQVSINVTAAPTSLCANYYQTYQHSNVVLFPNIDCFGTGYAHDLGFTNLLPHGNNMAKSMAVPSGKSVRIYDLPDRGGATRCVNGTMYNLTTDRYENGAFIATALGGTISSMEVFNNTTCYSPPTSNCPTYSSANVVMFADSECKGASSGFGTAGTRNLADFSFDNITTSIYVPSGKSVKVFEQPNRAGASRCITATMYNLSVDYYDSSSTRIDNTISSIEVFTNATCYTPPTSNCPTYSNSGIVLFMDADCRGATRLFASAGPRNNLAEYTFDNVTSSIYVPSGMSVRIYEQPNKTGLTRCITGTMYNLSSDNYDNSTTKANDNISSIEVFINSSCTPPVTSNCQNKTGSSITIYADYNCTGAGWNLNDDRFRNLVDLNFNDMTKSMYVPSGKSVKLYEHPDRGGGSKCVSRSLWDMRQDYYDNSSTPLVSSNGNSTVSSIETFTNTNCTPTVTCANFTSSSIIFFKDHSCTGDTRAFASSLNGQTRNLSDYTFDDVTSSIYVPSNMSVKVFEHPNRGGGTRCITGTMWNLSVDYYTSVNTGQVINDTISSIEVFTNNNCYTPPTSNCPSYSHHGVVPFADYECKGDVQYYYDAGWANLDRLNNNTRSLYVPSGKSVRLYEGSNLTGATKCVNTTLYDMRKDYYEGTSVQLVNSSGTANVSSLQIFNNSNCGEPNIHCQNYSSSYVTLFRDTNCYGERRYFVNSGFWNLPISNFNDTASSIYIPSGMSIKVFEHDNGGGSWSCYNRSSLWDLNQDWYQQGNRNLRVNDTITSIQVYNNTSCQ